MPRNTREWAHRKLQESQNNIEWSVYHLKDVFDRYNEAHPEISNPINSLMELLLEIHNHILTIRKSF